MARWVGLLLGCLLATFAVQASAEPTSDEALARAKELFRQGNELRKAGDCASALERFAASRALVPSAPNILNSAFCLSELGRADEALDEYTTLLTEYKAELSADEVAQLTDVMATLRTQVGEITIATNVPEAILVVDGRPRGSLPRLVPLRLLPGEHRVSVLRDGFESRELVVRVVAGKTLQVQAPLQVLPVSGRLRIDAEALAGADLVVDGAALGKVPWEGALAEGEHWYSLSLGDLGTAPRTLVVVSGQLAVVAPELRKLGPAVRISVEPREASLAIDSVVVGRGGFSGRLPEGSYRLLARAEGYLPRTLEWTVDARTEPAVQLAMQVDTEHPRWGVPPLRGFLELRGGFEWGPGFGSGAESSCSGLARCSEDSLSLGGTTELHGGVLFPVGVSLDFILGYARSDKSLSREFTAEYAGTSATFSYQDELSQASPFAAVGSAYFFALGEFDLKAGLVAGLRLTRSRDQISASASAGQESAVAAVESAGVATVSPNLFVRPELGAGLHVGDFRFGLDLGVSVMTLDGPKGELGDTFIVDTSRCQQTPASVTCAPLQTFVSAERVYSLSVSLAHSLSVRYLF